jgi:hypothetical protein
MSLRTAIILDALAGAAFIGLFLWGRRTWRTT